ncbi:MAG: hypothetical protein WBG48_15700 [Pricia sp.]
MKKLILLAILSISIFSSLSLTAQVERRGNFFDLINLERHQFKLNLFGPGLSYELGIFKDVSASTSFNPALAQYQEGYTFGFAWHTRVRFYHNFDRRIDLNKNVSGNSGNYISAARSIFWGPVQLFENIGPPDDFAIAFYGAVYGIQRTYKKGFNFNAEIGYGYYDGDGVANGHGPLLNFTFGWVATKRKSRKPTFD